MAQPILPFALPLIVCDSYASAGAGKISFYGAFHTIRPSSYPHTQERLCGVGHLTGGFGKLVMYVEVRSAETDALVFTSLPHEISIPDRHVLVRYVNTLEGVVFPKAGIYFVQLYCENVPIADFKLQLLELAGESIGDTNGKP